MSDLRNASFGKGVVGFLAAALVYIVIPVSLIMLVLHVMDLAIADIGSGSIDLMGMDDSILEEMMDDLVIFRDKVILYAIPIVILAFPKGLYAKGNFWRVPFGLMQAITIALWMWYITNGGVVPMDVDIPLELAEGLTGTATISMEVVLTGFIYLFMMVALAKGAYYFVEYGGNRKKYLEGLDQEEPDDEPPMSKKKKKEKDEDEDWEMV